jgi:hypothetical protein
MFSMLPILQLSLCPLNVCTLPLLHSTWVNLAGRSRSRRLLNSTTRLLHSTSADLAGRPRS